MTKQQARRLLLVALAISLLVHVLIAARLSWPFAHLSDATPVERIQHIRMLRVAKQPPPPSATPPPSPAPHRANSTKPRPFGTGGNRNAIASAPTPVPTPVASATPNCFKTDTPAEITQRPDAEVDLAPSVRALAVAATTTVLVKLDANGAVTDTSVATSSGNGSFDVAAMALARKAIYAPATHACKPIASDFTFVTKFSPW